MLCDNYSEELIARFIKDLSFGSFEHFYTMVLKRPIKSELLKNPFSKLNCILAVLSPVNGTSGLDASPINNAVEVKKDHYYSNGMEEPKRK
jgi:hypothetical protein